MLACLIVVVDLFTSHAFKLHRLEDFESESRKFLSVTFSSAAGTAFISLQPRVNAARTEHFFATFAELGFPADAKANLAAINLNVAAIYDGLTFEVDLASARNRKFILKLRQHFLAGTRRTKLFDHNKF